MLIYLTLLFLALFLQGTVQIGFIQPLTPFEATFVNTQLPSIYNFHFSLTSGLRSDAYLRISFPNYTDIGAPTCLFSVNQTRAKDKIECTAIDGSVYIAPNLELDPEDSVRAAVFLDKTIPATAGYTNLFELTTVSSTDPTSAIIFDANPGYGNFVWGPYSDVGQLFLEGLDFGTAATRNLQGASNDIKVYIRFNKAFVADLSRVIVVLDMPWKFGNTQITTTRSPLYLVAQGLGESTDLYDVPILHSHTVINDQVLEIFFKGTFPEGREFIMTITEIINPIAIAEGRIRFYSTDYTSNYVLEANDKTVIYTAENTLAITHALAAGVPFEGPGQLYKNAEQYIKISFLMDANIEAGSTIKYEFPSGNTMIPGTLYIAPSLASKDGNRIIYTYDTNGITLTNIGALATGTTITIQLKIKFSRVNPQFYTSVSILVDEVVVKYGLSDKVPIGTNANALVTNLVGSDTQAYVINYNGASSITFSFVTTSQCTVANSALTIYTSRFVTGTPTCTSSSGVGFSTCTATTASGYTKIEIKSATNQNAIPSSATVDITLGNLNFAKISSHEEAIYEFYLRLDKDGSGSQVQDLMVFAFVRPQRNQLTNFNQYHILNIQSNTLANFPSFMRMYGTDTAFTAITPTTNDDVVITIYGYIDIANFIKVTNEEEFPCGGSLTPKITCKFIKGSSTILLRNPLDWDRVIITLPSSVTSSAFNLYIPQFFKNSAAQIYELIVGTYDRTTRTYQNIYIETQYSTFPDRDTTFTNSANGLITNNDDLYIDLRGQRAGVLVPTITMSLMTVGTYTPNSGVNNGAAAVLITAWEFWSDSSAVDTPTTPLSTADQDATVFVRYQTTGGDDLNAVIWPMIGNPSTQVTFQLQNVEMPYSLDIPNYVMFLTDNQGKLTDYNSLINTGRNALSVNAITNFNFQCTHMIQNYLNTYCTLSFTPNAKIDRQTKVKVQFDKAFVTIAQCSLSYLDPTTIPLEQSEFSCQSSLGEIQLAFNVEERLPVTRYTLAFYGFDHGSGSSQSLTFTIFDANYGFAIEQATVNYFLELKIPDAITIDSMNYDFSNLDSISNLNLKFTLPRDIYPNEILEFDIGADLQGNNKNTVRLAIILQEVSTGNKIDIYGALKSQVLTIQFEQGVQLAAGSYILSIDNLKLPSTHSTDKIKIRLKRSSDNVFVLQSKEASFTSYPVLKLGASADISLTRSRFLCVGCLGEFVFQITLVNSLIDPNTLIYIHFPSYFLPAITNEEAELDCRMGVDPIKCDTDPNYPFRLKLTGSPFYLNPGDAFALTIYGFIVPNGGRATSEKEDIFFAIDCFFNGTYSEQSFLALPSLATIKTGFGALFFYNLALSKPLVRQNVQHVLRVNTTVDIPENSGLTITFTYEYSSIRFLSSLPCELSVYKAKGKYSGYSGTTCSITGQTVQFEIKKNILSGESLEITINNVPTPVTEVTVNPNEFIITAFGVDENDVIAISKESLNSISEVTFIDATHSIEAQDSQDILLTRGTYSDNIFVGTTGSTRVIQDVTITAITSGFTFIPNVINFYVGDISHTFKVGCDQNVKLRTYPLDFTQSQDTALVNQYGELFNVRVQVVDTPVEITIPSTLIVPVGGFSLPYAIKLAKRPFANVQILIDVDESYYNGAFGINEDYSSPSLNFTIDEGLGYLSFFSTQAITAFPSTFSVSLRLDGDNYEAYKLSTETIQIQIQNIDVGTATITGNQVSVGKTQASFQITPASEGLILIQLSSDCAQRQTLQTIKNLLRNETYNTLEITSGCWQRYFTIVMNQPGLPYSLDLNELVPETKYNLYVYFENRGKLTNADSPLSFTFTTNSLDNTVKMTAKFNKRIFIDQLNTLICFLLRLFETRIVNVVDAQGLSCSSFIEPTNRFLTFQGESFANFAETFSFYLLPDRTLEFDASSLSIPTYFNTTTNKAKPELKAAAIAAGITFLDDFQLDYSFSYTEARTSAGSIVMPTLLGFANDYQNVEGNATIRMTNFRMTGKGSVYAIARAIAKIQADPENEFGTLDITTRLPKTPTNDQIGKCQDWNGDDADACAKAVIANDANVELLLKDLKPNTMYVVYYTVANEYPIEPIFANDIQSFTIRVLSAGKIVVGWLVLLTCALLIFI